MMNRNFIKSFLFGAIAAVLLLGIFFGIISLISGWQLALSQWKQYWYFIVALAFGFGLQIGLYVHLKNKILQHAAAGKIIAVSGTTSAVAMLACCAHYLANIIPLVAVSGTVMLLAQYQTQLFWIGIVTNLAGIGYIIRKIIFFNKMHA